MEMWFHFLMVGFHLKLCTKKEGDCFGMVDCEKEEFD